MPAVPTHGVVHGPREATRRRKPSRAEKYEAPAYKRLQRRLGRRLEALRNARGWTQQTAAETCQLALRTYQTIEHGDTNVTLLNLAMLCQGFQVDVVELFGPPRKPRLPL